MPKQKVKASSVFFYYTDLDGQTIEDIIEILQRKAADLPGAVLEFDKDYDDDLEMYWNTYRLETDEEESARKAREAHFAKQRREQRRKEFEQLKKEFGE